MIVSDTPRGLLFVLVGPGGAGKNELMRTLLARIPNLYKLVTATTRPKRAEEVENRDHFFVSDAEFQQMLHNGELLEHTEVTPGKWYGIIQARVDEALNQQHDLIADIDLMGAQVLHTTYPNDVVLVFITVPGATVEEQLAILQKRMERRNEKPQLIQERLERARTLEFPFQTKCEITIVNADNQQEQALHQLEDFIHLKRQQRQGVLS